MIIDMHTHVFPEKIAKRAIENLERTADEGAGKDGALRAKTYGTLDGLKRSMRENGIDASVVLPVATKPSQFESINLYASEINGKDGIVSFGGIHPECDNIFEKLSYVKSLGLRGVKVHPDYQSCFADDERYLETVEACIKLGLYITFHAGWDIGYPEPMHCSPEAFRNAYAPLFERYPSEKDEPHVILAHLGGVTTPKRTLESLCGLPIYLDMAFTLENMQTSDIMDIIRAHGADRVLFATDSPWSDQGECKKKFLELPLTDEEKDLIAYKNAMRILGKV